MLMEGPPALMSSRVQASQLRDLTAHLLKQPQNPAWLEEDLSIFLSFPGSRHPVCTWDFLCWVFPEALHTLHFLISFSPPDPKPLLEPWL